jgi:hypothetical protein
LNQVTHFTINAQIFQKVAKTVAEQKMLQYQHQSLSSIIKQVASNKLSSLLKIEFQSTQKLQLNKNGIFFTKVIKRPSKESWVDR